jgi:ATP-dependent DNA helicase RecQ
LGFEQLRDGQDEVIRRVLSGADTLATMLAGTGKSLCYQLPAPHLRGATVAVSRSIALMKDQAEKLANVGVAIGQLNSAVPAHEQNEAMQGIGAGRSKVVFVTPERLAEPAALRRNVVRWAAGRARLLVSCLGSPGSS